MSEIKTNSFELDDTNRFLEARFQIERAADVIRQSGDTHLGSFAVHVFKQEFAREHRYTFSSQIVGNVPESVAIAAAKELRDRMLISYGHTPKATS